MTDATHIVAPEELMAYLDGELSADRAEAVADHIQSCLECSALTQQLQSARQTLSSWRVEAPSPLVDERIRAAAAKRSPQTGSLGTAIFQRTRDWTWKYWLAGFSAAALILLFSFAVVRKSSRTRANWLAVPHVQQLPEKAMREVTQANLPASARSTHIGQGSGYGKGVKTVDSAKAIDGNSVLDAYSVNGTLGRLGADQSSQQEASFQNGPMIARTASLVIVVKDFNVVRAKIDAILTERHGYPANLTVNTPEGAARSLEASLRVPVAQLAVTITKLKTLGRVETETQNGEEVTRQHADLVARLKVSRETEQRFIGILRDWKGDINQALNAEQAIARVRGEIEQMEAEQKNLEHRVDFATIDLHIDEEYKAQLNSPAPSVSTQVHNALVNGYRNVADSLLSLILFCAEYVPVLVMWCAILFIPAWLIWRRWRHALASA